MFRLNVASSFRKIMKMMIDNLLLVICQAKKPLIGIFIDITINFAR